MPIRSGATMPGAITVSLLLYLTGCNRAEPTIPASSEPGIQGDGQLEAMAEGKAEYLEIKGKFAQIIEDASARYHPVVYRFDEDLLAKMDRAEARLKTLSKAGAEPETGRLIPEIEVAEEDDHFRRTIDRWTEKTGRDFRVELDKLKADLAAVDKSKAFHPEFHKKFSSVFDDFVPIEVMEMRERRNRAIHQGVRALLAPHRADRPRTVAYFEKQIADPPYRDPDAKP